MDGKKCNAMAIEYLRGLTGQVRGNAAAKYKKKPFGNTEEVVGGEDMATGQQDDAQLAEMLAKLGLDIDDEREEEV